MAGLVKYCSANLIKSFASGANCVGIVFVIPVDSLIMEHGSFCFTFCTIMLYLFFGF